MKHVTVTDDAGTVLDIQDVPDEEEVVVFGIGPRNDTPWQCGSCESADPMKTSHNCFECEAKLMRNVLRGCIAENDLLRAQRAH